MRIDIRFVTPDEQRYDTLGDWWWEGEVLHIRATKSADMAEGESLLIALHELVEAWLCKEEGVPQAAVDAFDLAFTGEGEPGDDPAAPYRTQHRRAMLIEHLMAAFLGLSDYGVVR
jgi:hypothetical protein